MIWHNGAIMTSAATAAIFWGPSWVTNPGDKISRMDTWDSGFGNSNYAATSNEYTGTNGQGTSSVPYGGPFVGTAAQCGVEERGGGERARARRNAQPPA